ncbi:MAG TPA: non-canonical purine NTP pyrophosphatase [Armatimonadota bacterium]|jgi:inosine/xanthosine triphosphate pyrophosphatase family protein
MTILLATSNPAKQQALRTLLCGLSFTIVTPAEIGLVEPGVSEDRATHRENAEDKAAAHARAAGILSIASDGGLEIPALGALWDGLRTRRFAGPADADRIAALLGMLDGLHGEARAARMHEAVAVSSPSGPVASVERAGPWGRLAEQADHRASPGFWIPALYLYPPRWQSEWDLTSEERAGLRTAWDEVGIDLRPALRCYLNGRAC